MKPQHFHWHTGQSLIASSERALLVFCLPWFHASMDTWPYVSNNTRTHRKSHFHTRAPPGRRVSLTISECRRAFMPFFQCLAPVDQTNGRRVAETFRICPIVDCRLAACFLRTQFVRHCLADAESVTVWPAGSAPSPCDACSIGPRVE